MFGSSEHISGNKAFTGVYIFLSRRPTFRSGTEKMVGQNQCIRPIETQLSFCSLLYEPGLQFSFETQLSFCSLLFEPGLQLSFETQLSFCSLLSEPGLHCSFHLRHNFLFVLYYLNRACSFHFSFASIESFLQWDFCRLNVVLTSKIRYA